jgi:hypothetical protein
MKKVSVFFILMILLKMNGYCQTYPIFGNDIPVTINGLTFDAMEPALSTDGNALFFNSLNDGITTSIYYAAKVNDSVFNFIGLVPIINQTVTPHLDGVASLDSSNNLYWVSTRNYPASYNNLQRIKFTGTGYTNFGSVYGDFYINSPGHLIMDATTNYSGEQLIYCNAFFNNCLGGAPCKSSMGMAQKLNDSTFNKLINTSALFTNINDTTNYIVYAPSISKDGLELYYTRLLHNGTQTEIMVSVRTNTNQAFSLPMLLIGSPNLLPEAATISSDNSKIYYHKKVGGIFKIFLREKVIPTNIDNNKKHTEIVIFPNPASNAIFIKANNYSGDYEVEIYNVLGICVLKSVIQESIDVSILAKGIYYIKVMQEDRTIVKQIVKQ